MIITRTPYRISLFGGGSDHPLWFRKNGGSVLSFAINKYCYITTRILPPFFEHRYRIAYSKVEAVRDYELIEHPVVRESIKLYAPELGLEIHHDGDLPARSGIGSSSAFAVGMIRSILALKGKYLSNMDLANEAIILEHNILKENVGWQDQIACAVGGINKINFGPGDNWSLSKIDLDQNYIDQIQSRMILFFSGIQRISSDISSGLLLNLESKEKPIQEVMNLAVKCADLFQKRGDLDEIGEMLDYSWHLKKEMNPYSSTNELDYWYEKAKSAGALGGKVLGAGGGGFMLFWVGQNRRESFIRNMGSINEVPVQISNLGSSVIYQDRSQINQGVTC